MEEKHLAAVCGLYCGACTIYRARKDGNREGIERIAQAMSSFIDVTPEELDCDGCLAGGRLTPYCRQCSMRLCAERKHGVTRCSDCPDFPCSLVTDFNNDGMRHHAEVLDNLRKIAEVGVEAWLEGERKRWLCPHCGSPSDWYARTCFHCGKDQPRRLPSLPRDEKKK
ncbi:MAG: DUF3795 domain-containing protein [Deltaproteobacteria bacterium]|nr:DUF3795 domain-containing protein [Deltaproteobacteria bacterium]